MPLTLEDAISELVSQAQADRSVLHVAVSAMRLAKQYGGDSREIALLITNAGLVARLNMEMDMPKPKGWALSDPPSVTSTIHFAGHLTAAAEPPVVGLPPSLPMSPLNGDLPASDFLLAQRGGKPYADAAEANARA